MPLTFYDIERQKNWRIGLFFLVLVFIYFVLISLLIPSFLQIFSFGLFSRDGFAVMSRHLLILFVFSIIIAAIHFYFSAYDTVSYIKNNLGALEPDPEDGIHKRIINIVSEIQIASGDKRRIQCAVIPSLSMNALSAVDLKGSAIIAITEGMISRLSREQIETVMAHEAHHILSGDCLESTVATSLFGLPASTIEKMQLISEGRIFFSPAFVLAFILLKLSVLLNMFIAREREYRADAGAVRITRNPLALAEVLYSLSRNWRGVGYIGRGLEMLCIVNPQEMKLDESEGLFADLMSTHPPIRKRIDVLLKMARVNISELDNRLNQKKEVVEQQKANAWYYALSPKQQWQGPFTLGELALLPWLSPLTWISQGAEKAVERAWRDQGINTIFDARFSKEENEISNLFCPHCKQPLIKLSYEKTQVYQCRFCSGVLVDSDKIPRIIARKEIPCADRIKSLAKAVIRENQFNLTMRILKSTNKAKTVLIPCPKCNNTMSRVFYSLAYLIEIDRCSVCSITWFDTDELEMLQCLIENKITAAIALSE